MNSGHFKTIFSKRLGCLVAVGEHTSSQGKANGAASGQFSGFAGTDWLSKVLQFVGVLTASCALVSLAWAGPVATAALPTGGQVAQGAAAISQSGAVMNITQSTPKAVVNWNTFDIGQNAQVNIVQPSASAVMLNRVTSANPSQILGQLNANGQVVLVNPNGVLFGKDGSVNANSFTASTMGISDTNFMAGNHQFERNGSNASVVNQGSIKTTGGYVALLGASVSNEGQIQTQGGTAYLAAAETIKVPVSGSGRIKLELSPSSINAAVINAKGGTIVTEGGQLYMQAASLSTMVASIIQSGNIDSTGEQGGAVYLLADGGQIKVDGSITANSTKAAAGGDIYIGRDKDTNALAAVGDASGAKLESKGGFVETSGQFLATYGTRVTAKDWLLDPVNITISNGTSNPIPTWTAGSTQTNSVILAGDISANLNAGTNVKISTGVVGQTGDSGGQDGNIFVNAAIEKKGANNATLTLEANNRIIISARIGKKAAPADGDTGHLNVNIDARGNKGTAAQGVVVMRNVIDAGTGVVDVSATSKTGWEGLVFEGTTGITAGTYTVRGTSTSTAVRFNSGTATFNSSLGNSLIEGSGAGFGGVFAASGSTINLNTTGSAETTLASGENSTAGMRFGYGGGVTVNTNGKVTIGSHHNSSSGLFIQANVNVNGGHLTLKGKSTGNGIGLQDGSGTPSVINVNNGSSLTMDGISTTSGNGIDLRPQGAANFITMTGTNAGQRGTINLIGESSTGAGIYTSFANITSDGGNINLTGTSQGTGIAHDGLIRSGNASSGGVVTFKGTSTGSALPRLGINSSGSVQGGSVVFNGTSAGAQGVYTAGAVTAVAGTVTMTGTSAKGTGVHTQGQVRASGNITLDGTSNSTNTQGVIIQNNIESTAGDISVTGVTSATDQRAVSLTANGNIFGALKVANGRSIVVAADTLLINTGSTLNAGTTGTVNVQTTSENVAISLGAEDIMSSTMVLGLSQDEINRITAGQLNIGNTTHSGTVTVSSAITTNASTGHIGLQTSGDITFTGGLNVGGTTPTKKLTLNAGVQVTQAATAAIKATELQLLGADAEYKLNSTTNSVGKIAGSAKEIEYTNAVALSIDMVTGPSQTSTGIQTTGGTNITTQTGNLNINQAVSNETAGDIILGAGISNTNPDGSGGDIQTSTSGSASNTASGKKTYLYTGSANATGKLANISSSLTNLDFSEIDSVIGQNAESKINYNAGAGISGSTAQTQVLFRSQVAFDAPANGATLTKTYGDNNTQNNDTAKAALLTEAKGALKTANTGESTRDAGAGKLRISNAALIETLNGALGTTTSDISSSGFINANDTTYKYGALTSTKYTTTVAANQLQVKVAQKEVTLSAAKTYDGDKTLTGTQLTIATGVGSETLGYNSASINSKDVKDNGTNFVVTVDLADGTNGGKASNYKFTSARSENNTVTLSKASLTLTANSDTSKVYNGAEQSVSGFAITSGSLKGTDTAAVDLASITAGGKRTDAGTTATTVNDTNYTNYTNGNYAISKVDGSLVIGQKEVTLSAAKTYDGDKTLAGTQLTIATGVGSETLGYNSASINSKDVKDNGTNFVVTVDLADGTNGGKASNYKAPQASMAVGKNTVTIEKAKLTEVTGAKTYDGTTNLTNGTLSIKGVNGEEFITDKSVVVLGSKNVLGTDGNGANSVTNLSNLTLTGKSSTNTELASNYDHTQSTTNTAQITPRQLNITGSAAQDKTVDGNTNVQVKPGQLVDLVPGESLVVTASGQFADALVGTNKAVTAQYALANGANGLASNYVLSNQVLRAAILAASINPVQPIVNPARIPASGRVVVAGSGNTGAALGVADGPEEVISREECSVLNPEKCECQESTIPGVEMCFAPDQATNSKN